MYRASPEFIVKPLKSHVLQFVPLLEYSSEIFDGSPVLASDIVDVPSERNFIAAILSSGLGVLRTPSL